MRNYAVIRKALETDLDTLGVAPFLTSEMSVKDVQAFMLRNSFYKKLSPMREPSKAQIESATEKFLSINKSLPDDFVWVSESEPESCFYDYFRDHLNRALGTGLVGPDYFSYSHLASHITTGPGAAQKADAKTWHTKVFKSQLSYTNPELIGLYRTTVSELGSWADAEMQRFKDFGFVSVIGGKLFFVLKNVDEARTCCTEPGLNQLIQQGIRGYLEERAKAYFGIDIQRQPAVNRRLAMQGSLDESSCTIDLTSASDSNGLSLFSKVVEPCFLKRCILLSRCEVAVLPNGDTERLRMISTMGNGFTFPLMTILLASAVQACVDLLDPQSEWSVFGDDIVVSKRCYQFLIRMLVKLGYQPNVQKSFGVGPFRESCGHDYFNGHFVRGIYIKSLEASTDVYSAFNRLSRWSAATEIPLVQTLRLLKSMAHDYRVPPSEDDLAGFKVPFKLTKPRLTPEYWFKYRCLKRHARRYEIDEPNPDENPLDISFLVAGLAGVHKHTWSRNDKPGVSYGTIVSYGTSIRDPLGSAPRMKIANKSIPYWDYDKPESDPGESWYPGQPTKMLTRYDLDHWRACVSRSVHVWEDVVVEAFSTC